MSQENPAVETSATVPEGVPATQTPTRSGSLSSSGAETTPGAIDTHPSEGTTSTPTTYQGIQLRSGTILSGPSNQVSLLNILDKLHERARVTGKIPVNICDLLEKQATKTREQRLAQIQKLKDDTEKFKRDIAKFAGASRPLDSNNSVRDKLSESLDLSESELEAADRTFQDLLLDWVEVSLTDSSLENSLHSVFEPKCPTGITPPNMVEYAKVAKLTAQLVPLFSGEPTPHLGRELQTFIGCCKQTQQCLNDEEKEAFLQILPTRLRGDAYQLFISDIPTSFDQIEERLNRAYLPRESYHELVNRLINCRQNSLKAPTVFTTRVKQLLTLCNEASITKYGATAAPAVKLQLEDFAKNAVKSGVTNPHLCQYLLTVD